MVNVVYVNRNWGAQRVVGTFMYRTVKQWKLYIASRHTNFFVKYKNLIMEKYDISEDDYQIFTLALGDAAKGNVYLDFAVTVYSVLEIVMEALANRRDALDKYILKCISQKKDDVMVMISWSLQYQLWQATSWGMNWVTTSSKTIYDYF